MDASPLMASFARTPSRHVLVAEDDPDIRDLLVLLLQLEGCTVTAVGDGQAAVEASQAFAFRVAIMDISMPILDGLAAAASMKLGRPALRIVLHTAMDEDWVRKRFTGYDAYFRKPLDIDSLVRRLPSLMN